MNKKILKKNVMRLPKNSKVLDIGCSDCNMMKIIRKYRPDIEFHGINITTKGYTVPSFVNFKISNAKDIKYPEEFFDAVLCFHVLEHVDDTFKARNEIFRVLKKGGLFFGESPHWISILTPFGFNFWDDPSHIKPFSVEGFKNLINFDNHYDILYKKFDNPNFIYYPKHYEILQNWSYLLRLVIKQFGLYRNVAATVLRKKK